eukprot:TRINITY_DN23800_c0_g5_i1.p1 TRINITY_DN23800_c0_g5~~TRINITY_DN23800_c0_g5_i1.p1  ORF type:complete len:375 (+),score=183.44 TRINITY_DN23800_c0_g5_i1:84-1208(+)
MSLFMTAAARCDAAAAEVSPVPIDVAALERERAQRALREDTPPRDRAPDDAVDRLRRRETDERMHRVRVEKQREINVRGREQASGELQRAQEEEARRVEEARVAANRAERARQEQLRREAEERGRVEGLARHHEQLANRAEEELRALDAKIAAMPIQRAPRSEDDGDSGADGAEPGYVDASVFTQMERVRLDRERAKRIEAAMGLKGSVMDLYREAPNPTCRSVAAERSRLAAERVQENVAGQRRRLAAERSRLEQEEAAEEAEEEVRTCQRAQERAEAAAELVAEVDAAEAEVEAERQALREEEAARRSHVHAIDILQRQIAADLIDERDEEMAIAEDLAAMDHVQRLDAYIQMETETWREQQRFERQRRHAC